MIPVLLLAGLLAGQTTPAASPDPLAPARAGKLRCVAPNPTKLTCRTIIRYRVEANGDFDATVAGLVSRDATVLLRYKTFGRVEQGGVCVMMRTSDLQNGTLLSSGRPLGRAAEEAMRLQVLGAMQPMQGQKRCYVDRTEDGVTRSVVTLDGVAHPDLTQTVTWVSPQDGYAVGR